MATRIYTIHFVKIQIMVGKVKRKHKCFGTVFMICIHVFLTVSMKKKNSSVGVTET